MQESNEMIRAGSVDDHHPGESSPTSLEMLVVPSGPKMLLFQTLVQSTPPSVDFQIAPAP